MNPETQPLQQQQQQQQQDMPSSGQPQQQVQMQVLQRGGMSSVIKSVVAVVLVFLCLIFGNDILQQRGVLPPPPVTSFLDGDSGKAASTSTSPADSPQSSTPTITSDSAASSPRVDQSTTVVPRSKQQQQQQQQQQKTSNVGDVSSSSPYSIDTSAYWKQPADLFRNVFTPAKGIAALDNNLTGFYTEGSILQRSPAILEKDVFTCFDRFESDLEFALPNSEAAAQKQQQQPQPPFLPAFVVPSSSRRKSSSGAAAAALATFYRYDVVILPVGCFGDVIPPRPATADAASYCPTTSCRGIAQLSKFVSCGKRILGLILGDNFYPNGITHRREMGRQTRDVMHKFLRHPSLQRVPFYGTVGNHDHRPQMQYRNKDPFWVMPDAHHVTPMVTTTSTTTTTKSPSSSSYSVQVFLVSTQWGFDANYPHMAAEAQWLDEQLTKSRADVKIVASHEPIFGFLSFPHSRGLADFIHPVLVKHGVVLFISAHTHSVHFHRCTGGYYQLVSAGFADNLHPGVRHKRPRGHFFIGRGASAVAVNASHVVVTAFDLEGRHVFHHVFDWRTTVKDVKGWMTPQQQQQQQTRKKPKSQDWIERNEVGGSELWDFEPVCNRSSARVAASWCR